MEKYIAGYKKGTKARNKPDSSNRWRKALARGLRGKKGDVEYFRGFREGWAMADFYQEVK
jgi:hypothetical protein